MGNKSHIRKNHIGQCNRARAHLHANQQHRKKQLAEWRQMNNHSKKGDHETQLSLSFVTMAKTKYNTAHSLGAVEPKGAAMQS